MLRSTRLLHVVCSTSGDPYHVLGVTPEMPFAEIRQKFHELTQRYHPDMSSGDANRFREINSAYRELRATYRRRETQQAADADSTTQAKADAYYWHRHRSTNTSRTHEQKEKEDRKWSEQSSYQHAHRDQSCYCEGDGGGGPAKHRWNIFHNFFDGYEILLSLAAVLVVLVYSVQRYFVVLHLVAVKRQRVRNMEEGLPPSMPLKVEEEHRTRYKEPVGDNEMRSDSQRLREEMYYRRATQRRFDDMREFLFVYDPDSVGDCTVSTSRFSHQYIDEHRIAERCPIVREFDSEKREQSYNTIAKELRATLEQTPWWNAGAGRYGGLIAQGLTCVPANSTSTAKWTFIEYAALPTSPAGATSATAPKTVRDRLNDKDASSSSESASLGRDCAMEIPSFSSTERGAPREAPVCLAALRNLRFDGIGMCQRVIATEHVAHATKRIKNATAASTQSTRSGTTTANMSSADARYSHSSNALADDARGGNASQAATHAKANGAALVRGGALPLCHISVPLEKMKL